ncbi:MAG: lytic murein transglycosylase B [Nitrosospira sp.]|nr:lytic murein transglycosylase B [Nitrosospira sp.]
MRFLLSVLGFLVLSGYLAATAAAVPTGQLRPELETFIDEMVGRHGFTQAELVNILGAAKFQPGIINAISKPATSRPWHEFHPRLVNPQRVAGGVDFWTVNAATLERARVEFGIPEEIITAVIGIETNYGAQSGNHRVLDALTTLAFGYPRRAAFFRDELEQYLLLTREQGVDVLNVKGSYAGAIGIPQFMPSSYRRYAVDFDSDGKVDLAGSTADAIGSVANYLKSYGWETEQTVVIPARVNGKDYLGVLFSGNKPLYTLTEMKKLGVVPGIEISGDLPATLIELENIGGTEHWLGFNNFFVITRYNRSVNYAMSVLQLAEEIRMARNLNLR